jgi:hypothetical protein
MLRTAPDLARIGGAAVCGSGAVLVMFLRGVVGVKKDRMPPLPGAWTSFAFFGGMLPAGTNEGSEIFCGEL